MKSILGTPVEAVDDRWRELALVFAEATADVARAYVRRDEIRQERDRWTDTLNQRIAELEEQRRRYSTAEQALRSAHEAPRQWHAMNPLLWLLCLIVVGFVLWYLETMKRQQQIAALQRALSNEQAALARIEAAAQEANEKVEKLALDYNKAASITRTLVSVGRFHAPFVETRISNSLYLLDLTGASPEYEVKLPDFAYDLETLQRIRRAIENAKRTPILLKPSREGKRDISELHGEEQDLRVALDEIMRLVEAIPVITERLPLVPREGPLIQAIKRQLKHARIGQGDGAELCGERRDQWQASRRGLVELSERLQSGGRAAGETIAALYDAFEGVLGDYRDLRNEALDSLHEDLVQSMNRSTVSHLRYYCPRCNRVPTYLFHVLGVQLENAHEVDQRKLMERLLENEEAHQRINADDTILQALTDAYSALQELQHEARQITDRIKSTDNIDLGKIGRGKARLKAVEEQIERTVIQYRRVLCKLVTGDPRPFAAGAVELSSQARLAFNPDEGTWTCQACNTVFDNPETVDMGCLLRMKDDLMLPMWRHLWTEKEDFRKSEMFRTNEALQRMQEKESEKLIAIGREYNDDMRPVRENLILAATEAESKGEQLSDTVEGLVEIGLLDRAAYEQIKSGVIDEVAALKHHAETKEMLLKQEPVAQVQRREPASDPIDFLNGGGMFFRKLPLDAGDLPRLPGNKQGTGATGEVE